MVIANRLAIKLSLVDMSELSFAHTVDDEITTLLC